MNCDGGGRRELEEQRYKYNLSVYLLRRVCATHLALAFLRATSPQAFEMTVVTPTKRVPRKGNLVLYPKAETRWGRAGSVPGIEFTLLHQPSAISYQEQS